MGTAIDLSVLRQSAHSPSYFKLSRSMGEGQARVIDFCIPCNPYFPSPEMFAELGRNLETILKYYPSDADSITSELCGVLRLHPQTVAMANGSTELLTWIDHLLVRESLATPIPTFGRWTDQPHETGKRVDMFPLRESAGYQLNVDEFVHFVRQRRSRVAVVCNPNNPDGGYLPRREVIRLIDALGDLDLVVVDESFIDFVDAERDPSVAVEAMIRPNVIVLKSLGKNFGLHGVRFGYLVANPALAGTIRRALPKWNLNSFAEAVVFMLKAHHEAYRDSLRRLARDRWEMAQALTTLPGLTVFTASQGNFLLVKLPDGYDGGSLRDRLVADHGVFVRDCGNKLGITSQFLRLVVRPRDDVAKLYHGLRSYLPSYLPAQQSQPGQHADPRYGEAALAVPGAGGGGPIDYALPALPAAAPAEAAAGYSTDGEGSAAIAASAFHNVVNLAGWAAASGHADRGYHGGHPAGAALRGYR